MTGEPYRMSLWVDNRLRPILVRDHGGYPDCVVELSTTKLYVKDPWDVSGRVQYARRACGCEKCVFRKPETQEVLITRQDPQSCVMAAEIFRTLPEYTLKPFVRHMEDGDSFNNR